MNQELEIEFKNLLTKEEFITLLEAFSVRRELFQTQVNHYFDTNQFSLKEKHSALRIRFKKKRYTLTLKQTIPEGILETHQALTDDEAQIMLNDMVLLDGDIKKQLKNIGINEEKIKYFGKLTTNRAEIPYENGLLVFDHSRYLDQEDYELEYEVADRERGYEIFLTLLHEQQIPVRKTANKIQRFFNAKLNGGQL